MSNRIRFLFSVFSSALLLAGARGADATSRSEGSSNSSASPTVLTATDPSYRLITGDTIMVTVSTQSNQTENSAAQTIGRSGDVRLPWIKEEVVLGGKTVREAERFLENLYRERKLLKAPVVSVKVSAYFPREVSVLGAVRGPGSFPFPPDVTSLDIVQVITKAGGFSPVARQDKVTVTHRAENGEEKTQILDLRDAFSSRVKPGRDRAEVLIYPGDRIWVPESLF